MKIHFFNILLICCVTIFSSCSKVRPEDATDYKFTIIMEDTLDVPSWDDMIDSVCYIPLNLDDNTFMGEIEQMVVKDELIYLLANGIYCFDMEGDCRFKITNRGRARNEFIDPASFSVADGNIYLYDKMKHKLIVYDAHSGKYIEDIETPIGGSRVYCTGDSFVFDDVQSDVKKYTRFKIYSKDKPDHKIAGYFSDKEHVIPVQGTCTWTNDGLIYSSYLRSLAWKINDNGCIPYIKVIIPERIRLSDKTIKNMITDNTIFAKGYNTHKAIYGLSFLVECEEFITGRLSDDKNYIFFLFDKITGNSKFFSKYVDSEGWKLFPIGEGCAGDANCMYSVVSSESVLLTKAILGGLGKEPTDESFRKAYSVVNSIKKDDDNPIIARFWLSRL